MRVAVISDIHANGRALAAVLADIDAVGVDETWCLGDVVGYGPDPDGCCALVGERCAVSLVGNHDLAVLGTVDTSDFNAEAAAATEWTRARLDESSRAFLAGLEPTGARAGVGLYHASPIDPVWDYVLTFEGAQAALEAVDDDLVLVGHTHVPIAMALIDGRIEGAHAPGGTDVEVGGARRLLNPGSVGQPRDRDPRAAWLLLDLAAGAGTASFRRVEYDVAGTQEAMLAAGLPTLLAERLSHGL